MNKTLTLFLAFTFVVVGSAQSQSQYVATLDHEGTTSIFTGSNAFVEAHAAAAHGDVITLSAGLFTSPEITKAVTVYGTGIVSDSVSAQTILTSVMYINIPDTVEQRLTLEGLYFQSSLIYTKANSPVFNKCKISSITRNTNSWFRNASFNHCRVAGSAQIFGGSTFEFHNCYINQLDVNGGTNRVNVYNCVLFIINPNYVASSYFSNCYIGYSDTSTLSSSAVAENCVSTNSNLFKNVIDNSTDVVVDSLGAVFKTWRGGYDDHETFELTDEAKTKYLGSDGTQIGIYGGAMPYDPTPTNPRITKFQLTPKPAERKLEIQVEAR